MLAPCVAFIGFCGVSDRTVEDDAVVLEDA